MMWRYRNRGVGGEPTMVVMTMAKIKNIIDGDCSGDIGTVVLVVRQQWW